MWDDRQTILNVFLSPCDGHSQAHYFVLHNSSCCADALPVILLFAGLQGDMQRLAKWLVCCIYWILSSQCEFGLNLHYALSWQLNYIPSLQANSVVVPFSFGYLGLYAGFLEALGKSTAWPQFKVSASALTNHLIIRLPGWTHQCQGRAVARQWSECCCCTAAPYCTKESTHRPRLNDQETWPRLQWARLIPGR